VTSVKESLQLYIFSGNFISFYIKLNLQRLIPLFAIKSIDNAKKIFSRFEKIKKQR
jgi:hypothetical protein